MDLKIWSKTILNMYKYLDIIDETIDELVRRETVGSNHCYGYRNTYDSYIRIINMTERKRKLLTLKVLCEDVVSHMDEEYIDFVSAYYFDGYKANDVCEMLDISMRTFYRMKKDSIVRFSKILKCMGYSEETLSRIYGDEEWLMNALQYNSDPKLDERVVSYKILKCVSHSF